MASYRGSSTSVDDNHFTPQSRRNQRLSKPRTNTSPTVLPSASGSGLDLSSSSDPLRQSLVVDNSDSVVAMPAESSKSRRESRQKLRGHLFGSDLAIENAIESDEEARSGNIEGRRGVKERFARTGSMITKRTSIRISLNPLSKSLSSSSLVREPSTEPVDEGTIEEEVKQKVFNDKLAALSRDQRPSQEEGGKIDRVISPIRRRSLFTPGLATRNPSDILRKPPNPIRSQSEAEHEYYFNPSLSEFSPLARLAALDLANQRKMTPEPRSATPADLDYGHLGGLGSLRITNGVASPVPSMRSTAVASRKSSRFQDDYVNFQGDAIPVLKEIHRRSGEYVDFVDTAERVDRQSGEIGRIGRPREVGYERKREGSLLKYAHSNSTSYPGNDFCDGESLPSRPELFDRGSEGLPPDRTSFMAQKYMDDLPQNPFSTDFESGLSGISVQATSKPSELDDELFDQQSIRSDYSQQSLHRRTPQLAEAGHNRGSFAEEVLGMLAGVRGSRSTLGVKQAYEDPVAADDRLSQYLAGPSSATSKSDSGYGSSTSLRSLRKQTTDYSDERAPRPGSRPIIKERHPSRPRTMPIAEPSPTTSSNSRPSLLTVPSSSILDGSAHTTAQASSETTPTLASSKGSSSQLPVASKKLRKTRPKSQPPPINRITIQGFRDLDGTHIPPIPADIAARNAARLQKFPPLEHTLPSVDHEGFQDYVSIPPPLSAPLRFPSPVRSEKHDRLTLDKNGEHTDTSSHMAQQQPTQKRFNLRRLSQSFRRSSRQYVPDTSEEVDAFADLGDVANSLGQSPYDVAGVSLYGRPMMNNDSAMYPHQMTTATSRGRPAMGMNEEEAAQLSRMRGIHGRRVSLSAGNDHFRGDDSASSDTRPRPPIQVRRSFDDRGGIPGKMLKANNVSTDAPPIPAIPVAVQVERREAELVQRDSPQDKQTPSSRPTISRPATQRHSTSNFAELRPDWQAQRETWAQKRKSAGEALAASEENSRSATPSPTRAEPGGNLSPGHSSQNLAIPKGTVARLSGRFEGGFGFGYEPGQGVGGSAGTRGVLTGASRKSVDVSRGFGIDFSDVPIFVSPSQ